MYFRIPVCLSFSLIVSLYSFLYSDGTNNQRIIASCSIQNDSGFDSDGFQSDTQDITPFSVVDGNAFVKITNISYSRLEFEIKRSGSQVIEEFIELNVEFFVPRSSVTIFNAGFETIVGGGNIELLMNSEYNEITNEGFQEVLNSEYTAGTNVKLWKIFQNFGNVNECVSRKCHVRVWAGNPPLLPNQTEITGFIDFAPFTEPELISPSRDSFINDSNISFSWKGHPETDLYRLEIYNNFDLTGLFAQRNINNTSEVISTSIGGFIIDQEKYYWRVEGLFNDSNGNVILQVPSPVYSFTKGLAAIPARIVKNENAKSIRLGNHNDDDQTDVYYIDGNNATKVFVQETAP